MLRTIAFVVGIGCLTAACLAHEPDGQLPHPHWQPKPSDPPWMAQVVQLHGHLGPWVIAGARLGMAGAKAVGAKGHFDANVICEGPFEKPPESCFLDGVQHGTGATLGKRTIQVVNAKAMVLRIANPRTGERVEVRPTKKLMDILNPPEAKTGKKAAEPSMEQVEQMARDIAAMPDAEILVVSRP